MGPLAYSWWQISHVMFLCRNILFFYLQPFVTDIYFIYYYIYIYVTGSAVHYRGGDPTYSFPLDEILSKV